MEYIDNFYTSSDGLRLYARDYPGPRAGSTCVICLPGLTRNSKDFAKLAAHLSNDYRVICPDQRGRGRSERDKEAQNYRPDRYVMDMLTLLDTLRIERVAVIGTSLGALMAISMMAVDPQRVIGAVLNDAGPEIDPRGVARIASYVGKLPPVATWDEAVLRTKSINESSFPDFTAADWESMTRDTFFLQDGAPVADYDPAISQGVANGSAAPNLWPLFEKCAGKPILSIRGECSDILARETVAEMTRRMPRLEAVTIERVGHAPTLNEPQARAAIRGFLARIC